MAGLDVGYLTVYLLSLASVAFAGYMIVQHSRRTSTSLGPSRLLGLAKDETRRLTTGDPVFLMHLSIAVGIGLTIANAVLDPAMGYLFPLRLLFLAVSVPLIIGLAASFVWRVQVYFHSKGVEREFNSTRSFTSASTFLQGILMLAIALTTSELVLIWFPSLAFLDQILDALRNSLVAIYYSRPSVNLVGNFDRPLATLRAPFLLADVMSGKTDPSQVQVGVSKVAEFSTAEKLSYDSCVEIGACEAACPATASGRPLSPRVLVRKVSLLSRSDGKESAEVSSVVGEDELWSCTSCGACVSACPVSVKHLDVIYDLRRDLVAKGKLDKEKTAMLENLAQNQNPYGFKNATRGDWARDLGVDTLASIPRADYLYWGGCV